MVALLIYRGVSMTIHIDVTTYTHAHTHTHKPVTEYSFCEYHAPYFVKHVHILLEKQNVLTFYREMSVKCASF